MMKQTSSKHIYGPVPSRRLGRSLGIDLVPFKTCSYDCIYCQLGRTTTKTIERQEYVRADDILTEFKETVASGIAFDYVGISGSGEPTLHSRIGYLIDGIKSLTPTPVAVLTNGSLLWMREVQDALMAADFVLPSLDAGDERMFRYVNRPHEGIEFKTMVDGLTKFTERFPGVVWLEVFLVAGVTGKPAQVRKIAEITRRIRPAQIQLNTVARPPAEEFVGAVSLDRMEGFKALFPGDIDLICDGDHAASAALPLREATEAEIMALVSRRPCVLRDIAFSLNIHPTDAAKYLQALNKAGKVTMSFLDGEYYYSSTRTTYTGEGKR